MKKQDIIRLNRLAGLINENVEQKLKENYVEEEASDLDANLPNMVEKFLEKLIAQLKGYNLNRKKQVAVIAKVIDGLGMDKNDVMRAIQKIKQSGVLSGKPATNEAFNKIRVSNIKEGDTIYFIKNGNPENGITKAEVKSIKGNKIKATEYAKSGWNSDTEHDVNVSDIIKFNKIRVSNIKEGDTIYFIKNGNPENGITKAEVKSIKGNKIKATEYAKSGWNSDTEHDVNVSDIIKISDKK